MVIYDGQTYYDRGWIALLCVFAALAGAGIVLAVVGLRSRPFGRRAAVLVSVGAGTALGLSASLALVFAGVLP